MMKGPLAPVENQRLYEEATDLVEQLIPFDIRWERVHDLLIVHPTRGFLCEIFRCADKECGRLHTRWSFDVGLAHLDGFVLFLLGLHPVEMRKEITIRLLYDLAEWHKEEWKKLTLHVTYLPLREYTAMDSIPLFKPALPAIVADSMRDYQCDWISTKAMKENEYAN